MTAALSVRVESLAVMRFRAFSANILSGACRSAKSFLCEYAMSCSRHAASNKLIPWSSLENRFSGSQNWYLGICSKGSARHLTSLSMIFAAILYRRRRMHRQYAFDDSVNCNVSDTDSIVVPPYLLVYVLVICPTTDLCNVRTIQFSVCVRVLLLRLNCADYPTRNILITDWFHSTRLYK